MFDDGKKMMASLALFRKLYNNDGTDVLVLLGEFIKLIIKKNGLYSFSASDIKNRLVREYDFTIPESVVETALKKFCKKENGNYFLKEDVVLGTDNDTCAIKENNDELIDKLTCYIEDKTKQRLSATEKEELVQSFCEFIIEDVTQVKYADYISAFIIECQNDANIREQLRTIKEGVVLYTGIKYNDNVAEVGSWKNDFTIYLEQEMLFHFAGYNGELYKRLFDDFIGLVKEINRKATKEVIKLKYFPEVEANVNKFFATAQRITDGKETLDPSNTAMNMIVTGCEDGADVTTKKSQFYEALRKSSITVSDNIFIGDKDNMQYNICTEEKANELKQNINDIPEENILQSLEFINYINVGRKNRKFTSLERSECILLTGNNTTMKVDLSFRENGYVPYVTTLDFLTTRIWRKLNKGFGDNKYPKSFDVVTKAQIVLSSHIAGSVSKEFENLKQSLSDGTISKDVAARTLVDLRAQVLKPEDISTENTEQALLTISDIEIVTRELDNKRNEYELTHKKLETIEEEKRLVEQEKHAVEEDLYSIKNELLIAQRKNLKIEEDKKSKADKAYKRYNRYIYVCYYILPIALFFLIIWLIYNYSWDIMEQYTYLFSLLPLIGTCVCNVCFGHNINPKNILSKMSMKLKRHLYKKYEVNETEIERLQKLISSN
ncbi:MAG: calcium uniporter family protein [Bacteroidales bacterium]|nr:calcium uniporter family protein [Bacteroidales bacterium]